jgi:hypothetical protein
VIRFARPEERSHHSIVAKRLAHALRLDVVQHLLLGSLAAAELDEDVLWVAPRPPHELDAHLLARGARVGAAGAASRAQGAATERAWAHVIVEDARNVLHGSVHPDVLADANLRRSGGGLEW